MDALLLELLLPAILYVQLALNRVSLLAVRMYIQLMLERSRSPIALYVMM